MLLILFMQYSPLPVPKANHKGVFVLNKFKVSSSKGKLVRGLQAGGWALQRPGCQSRNMVRSRVPAGLWRQEPGLWISSVNWVDGALGWGRRELLTSVCKGPSAPCPRALFLLSAEQSFIYWSQSKESEHGFRMVLIGRVKESVSSPCPGLLF